MMKHVMKKALALTLTAVMLLSAFAIAPTAATPTKPIVTEDFQGNVTTSATGLTTASVTFQSVGGVAPSSANFGVVADPTVSGETENKVLKFDPTNKDHRFILFPQEFKAQYYTWTGEFYFNFDVRDARGFTLAPDNHTTNHIFQVYGQFVRSYDGCDTTSGPSGNGVMNQQSSLQLGKKWIRFEYVRQGELITLRLWNTVNGELIYQQSRTFCQANIVQNNAQTPHLWFTQPSATGEQEIYLDNFCYSSMNYAGAQASAVENDKYSVRFLGAIDSLDYAKVGVKLAVRTAGGAGELTRETTTVYGAINAGFGAEEVSANALGGNYMIALAVKDIPVSVGEVLFDVTFYGYPTGSDTPIEAKTVTLKATANGTAIVLQRV